MDAFGVCPKGALVQPQPFKLHVTEKDLAEFRILLELSKVGPATWENNIPEFGVTRDWFIRAKDVWLNNFDWRAHEQRINSFPNFKTVVKDPDCGDCVIHFAALFSKKTDAVPVMLLHGWPGSFLEFLPMVALLANKYTPETLPYHFIVPSLPGFTLSHGPPLGRDFSMGDLARIMNQFMIDLGFGKRGYIAQGGDVGCLVSRLLAASAECKAIHVNMMMLSMENVPASTEGVTASELDDLASTAKSRETNGGYIEEHRTRPGTIGLVISSSPLALLAWLGEKWRDWADPRHPLDLDTILGEISLYWFTGSFPRSIYPYRALASLQFPELGDRAFGYSRFGAENLFMPVAWCRKLYPNMIRYEHEKGGHFAALEQPALLLEDVEDFVSKCSYIFS